MDSENIPVASRGMGKMIAGQLAVVAIPVFGWLTFGYDIIPDIGILSFSQQLTVIVFVIAFVLAVIYAALATARCFKDLWKIYNRGESSLLNCFLFLPFPGCFFIPVILLKLARKSNRLVKWAAWIYMLMSVLSVATLVMLYFTDIKWVPTVAIFTLPVLYIFMLSIVYSLATKPVFSLASGIVIRLLLVMIVGPLIYTGFFLHNLNSQLIAGREKLEQIYQRPLNRDSLKKFYYQGKKPNLHKFVKVWTYDEKDGRTQCALQIPDSLFIFLSKSFTNVGQQRELSAWVKKNKALINELDRVTREEKYLKIPESIRDYDGLLVGLLLPELNVLRNLTRICSLRLCHALNERDVQTALAFFNASWQLKEYTSDDHCLISVLVYMAIESIHLSQLQKLIESKLLDDQQLKQIIVQLKQDMGVWDNLLQRAMFGETVIGLDVILHLSRPMNEYVYFKTGYFSSESDFRRLEDKFFDFNDYLLKFFLAPVISIYSEDLLYSVNAYIRQGKMRSFAAPEYLKMTRNIPDKLLLSKLMLPEFSAVESKIKIIRGKQQAAIMAFGVELYRRKNGQLPEALDELIPEFIDKVYPDPFTGKPMKYIKGEYREIMKDCRMGASSEDISTLLNVRGYKIYFMGINKRDDNGLRGTINKKNYDDFGFSVIDKAN